MFFKTIANSRNSILTKFPQQQFDFCFAYGSGVKKQIGYDDGAQVKNMIDLIFCVHNTTKWHSLNLGMNPTHYSGLKLCGSSGIAQIQKHFGASVYCNTLIPWENGSTIKYGVVSDNHLIDDLVNWTHLYLAGRLHKPVEILHLPTAEIQDAVLVNLKNAMHTSLLLLPEKFTFYDLFYKISNLSYSGDFRMIFGENKDKVKNIVKPQLDEFYKLYLPTLQKFSAYINIPTDISSEINQNKSSETMLYHLNHLPGSLTNRIVNYTPSKQIDEALITLSTDQKMPLILNKCIRNIVWHSSVSQSIKNIPTAGIVKSLRYSWKKALKTFSA